MGGFELWTSFMQDQLPKAWIIFIISNFKTENSCNTEMLKATQERFVKQKMYIICCQQIVKLPLRKLMYVYWPKRKETRKEKANFTNCRKSTSEKNSHRKHCVKSVRISPYSVRMWEKTDQKNSEYEKPCCNITHADWTWNRSSLSQMFYKTGTLKGRRHRCFSVNFVKFLSAPFLQKICERLLLMKDSHWSK